MKLTREKYLQVKKLLKKTGPYKLAKSSDVSISTLYRVKNSKSYKNYKTLCLEASHSGLQPYNTTTVDDMLEDYTPPKQNWFQRIFLR